MHLGFIRMLAAIFGIALALATICLIPAILIREGWWHVGHWLGGQWPVLWLPDGPSLAFLRDLPPFAWGGQPLPHPPAHDTIVVYSLALMVAGMALISLLTVSLPLRYRVKAVCGHTGFRLPAGHAYQGYVNDLAHKYRTGHVHVRRIPHGGILAFVLSSPQRRHVIAVSDGLFAQPPAIVHWVLAHEMAHIHYGDTQSTTLWITAFRSIRLLDALRVAIMNSTLRLLFHVPLLRLLTTPVLFLFRVVIVTGRLGYHLGRLFFVAVDRWVSRRMEYRADRFAVAHAGSAPGLHFFQYLVGAFEPSFNLLATHPSHLKRYDAILKWEEQQGAQNAPAPETPK